MSASDGRGGRYEVVFALPVFIPFDDGYEIAAGAYGAEASEITTLTFRRTEGEWSRPFHAIRAIAEAAWGAKITDTGPDDVFRDRITVVVASTPTKVLWDDEPSEELRQPYIARILRLVASVVEAFGLISGKAVPRLGPTTMFPVLVDRYVNAGGHPGSATVSLLAGEEAARRFVRWTLPMSQDDIVKLATTGAKLDRVRAGRPYFTAVRLLSSAERSFAAREPEAAIVESSSAIEAMVNELVRSMARELGAAPPAPKTPFRKVFRDYLVPWLRLNEQEPAVARWLASGYELRHRVVHEGISVRLAEAKEALEAAEALGSRIDDALVADVRLVPRTAARKLGRRLLERVEPDDALRAIVEEETTSPLLVGVVTKKESDPEPA